MESGEKSVQKLRVLPQSSGAFLLVGYLLVFEPLFILDTVLPGRAVTLALADSLGHCLLSVIVEDLSHLLDIILLHHLGICILVVVVVQIGVGLRLRLEVGAGGGLLGLRILDVLYACPMVILLHPLLAVHPLLVRLQYELMVEQLRPAESLARVLVQQPLQKRSERD